MGRRKNKVCTLRVASFVPLLTVLLVVNTANSKVALDNDESNLLDRSICSKIESIFADIEEKDPGVSLVITRQEESICKLSFGLSNIEHGAKVKSNTVFDLASLSKQFTAFAVAMLVEKGELSLEARIRDYIPTISGKIGEIRLYQLLNHTSGLKDWTAILTIAGYRFPENSVTSERALELVMSDGQLNFEPGEEFSYSNSGYVLLTKVVEAVTKSSFQDWMEENIFQPLGMNHTRFVSDSTEIIPGMAQSYFLLDGKLKKQASALAPVGSSSLFSTTDDIERWLINYHSMTVGNARVMALINQKYKLNSGISVDYTFGNNWQEYRGLKMINHGGRWRSFVSNLTRFPDQKIGIALLSNYGETKTGNIRNRISEILLGNQFAEEKPESDSLKAIQRTGKTEDPEAYVGLYRVQPGWFAEIEQNNDEMWFFNRNYSQKKVKMEPLPNDTFWAEDINTKFTFGEKDILKYGSFLYDDGYGALRAERIPVSSPEMLESYSGTYINETLGSLFKVHVQDTRLVVLHTLHGEEQLKSVNKDYFLGGGEFIIEIKFERSAEGKVVGLNMSSIWARNIEFRKV